MIRIEQNVACDDQLKQELSWLRQWERHGEVRMGRGDLFPLIRFHSLLDLQSFVFGEQ